MSDRYLSKQQQAIEIAQALLKAGACPFDGKHFSSLSRATCLVCNPPKETKPHG